MSVITRIDEKGPCACAQLRRAARAVTALYDGCLADSGLTVTQFSLLVNIGRNADGVSRTVLAKKLGMDRTTLTRNLRPLEKQGLIAEQSGEDRRARVLRLSPDGWTRIELAYPAWERAQEQFLERFGQEEFSVLLGLLKGC